MIVSPYYIVMFSILLTPFFPTHPLGTTYRTREEVGAVRQARDPIEYVKKLLIDENLSTADDIKQMEKEIRNQVQDSLTAAKAGSPLSADWLTKEIYCSLGDYPLPALHKLFF